MVQYWAMSLLKCGKKCVHFLFLRLNSYRACAGVSPFEHTYLKLSGIKKFASHSVLECCYTFYTLRVLLGLISLIKTVAGRRYRYEL